MACINHPAAPEVDHCHRCGQPICGNCTVSVNGQIYCQSCVTNDPRRSSQSTEESWVQLEPGHSKSRGLALLLSLIPGGGYMYLGLMNRGLQTLLIFFGAIFVGEVLNIDFLTGLVVPVLMLYTIFDTQQILGDLNRTGRVLDRGFFEWKAIGLKNPIAQNPDPDSPRPTAPFSPTAQPGATPGASGFDVGGNPVQNDSTELDPDVSSQHPGEAASSSTWTIRDEETPDTGEAEAVKLGSSEPSLPQNAPPQMPLPPLVNPQTQRRRTIAAYILIGAGVLLLVNNLFPDLLVEKYLRMLGGPVVLISLGILMLYRTWSRRKED